ncbi:MAG TPA: FAD-dependent oxidoreductase, partial [Bryobacteraceae bacterium]|nr:FAD-dependent oxidoreductase [Bryobacteraceae bacterium]
MIVKTRHVEWIYVTYDLIVIGSGPGGYSAAVRAGQYGLKTAIVEKDSKLGGVCLHVGCIPTKALLHTAEMWHFATHSDEEGISIDKPVLNYAKAVERKAGIVNKHAKGVEFLMKKNKVEVVPGYATIKGPGKVEVKGPKGDTKVLETKNILIATGSEAR